MARVYVGDQSRVNPAVLEEVQQLPDDFWVLAEFSLLRNYDWFVLHPFPDSPAALITVEEKRVARGVRGSLNSVWEMREDEEDRWEPLIPSNRDDRNPYWQAVNAANSLSDWLRNNEPVFNDGESGVWTSTKIWPDLLLISPPGVRHFLPLKPDNGYGSWYFDLRRWSAHVRHWKPNVGPILTHDHVARLVAHLQLEPVDSPAAAPGYGAPSEPAQGTATLLAPPPPPQPQPVVDLGAAALERHVHELERRVSALESTLHAVAQALGAAPALAASAGARLPLNGGRVPSQTALARARLGHEEPTDVQD